MYLELSKGDDLNLELLQYNPVGLSLFGTLTKEVEMSKLELMSTTP